MSRSGTVRVGAALATLAALLLSWGALSRRWYVSGEEPSFHVGLVLAERCDAGGCQSAPISRIDDRPEVTRFGLAVALIGVLAAVSLLAATARALQGTERFPGLPRLALGLSVFAVCAGVGYIFMAPWSATMAPSLSAFAYFGGAAVGGAVAGVLLGGLRQS